jgi:hypothetical protein
VCGNRSRTGTGCVRSQTHISKETPEENLDNARGFRHKQIFSAGILKGRAGDCAGLFAWVTSLPFSAGEQPMLIRKYILATQPSDEKTL